MKQLRKRAAALLLSVAMLLSTVSGDILPAKAAANTEEVLINSMEDIHQWRVENAESITITSKVVSEHAQGDGALEISAVHHQKSNDVANLVWNPDGGLDLTGAQKLLMDVYLVEPLGEYSFNVNITNDNAIIFMGSPMAGVKQGQWTTVEIDLSGKNVNNLTEIKFWTFGQDMPSDAACTMTWRIDNLRIVRDKQQTEPPVQTQVLLLNAMEDENQWRQESTASVAIQHKLSPEHTEGSGSLEIKGTYYTKSGDFASLIWNPTGLNLNGAQKLLMDVFVVEPLGNLSLNVNLLNNGQIFYMDSPLRNLEQGKWNTVEIDLTGKDVSGFSELKFWIYGQDMPGDSECSMTYRIDNLRVEMQMPAPDVVAEPASGSVLRPGEKVTLSLQSPAAGSTIHYTTDGTDPKTSTTAQIYTDPVEISAKTEIRAYAEVPGMAGGAVKRFRYTLGTGNSGESFLGLTNFGYGRFLPALSAKTITIDGKLDEWDAYSGISLPLDKYFPANPENFSLTAKVAYDDSNLYLGIDVMDDYLSADYGFGMYGGDCIQVAFSEFGSAYGPEYGFSNVEGRGEIWRWATGSAIWDKDTINYRTLREDGHTYYEIALPWQAIFSEPPRDSFYMTILAGDRDAHGASVMEWRSGIGSGKVADDFALVELVKKDTQWGLSVAPVSVKADSAEMDGYLYNLSNQNQQFRFRWNGEETTVDIPAGMVLRKRARCAADAEGIISVSASATAPDGTIKEATWNNRNYDSTMPPEEQENRNEALENRLGEKETLKSSKMEFSVSKKTGSYQLRDLRTGVLWASNADADGIGAMEILTASGNQVTVPLQNPAGVVKEVRAIRTQWRTNVEGKPVCLDVVYTMTPDDGGVTVSYEEQLPEGYCIKTVNFVDHALWTLDTEDGYAVVPEGMGVVYKAEEPQKFTKVYESYGNYNMAFVGLVKNGSALLLDWKDPNTALVLHHNETDSPLAAGSNMISVSLRLSQTSKNCTMRVLGEGGYVQIAKAYRSCAKEKGYLKTFAEKVKENPDIARLYGAAMAKPDTMIRGKDTAYTSHTFAEVGKVASHWKEQLGIDKALFTVGGWNHMGFDNQYPDILPAAPEAGGNEGLAALAAQVKGYGWLFGMHDNYQDMYVDAPSFAEKYLMFTQDGRPQVGGVWAGGTPYLMAADKAMEFAHRNLPQVEELFHPNSYFIDTTFNVPLNISYAPNALTRNEDLYWKQQLANLAKQHFGVFGSEGGMEWGVPYGDYFEGVLSTKINAAPGSHTIPLMELVYGDCVVLCAHMGDKLGRYGRNTAKAALVDILYSENPLYQLDDGIYYESDGVIPAVPSVDKLVDLGNGKFEITYKWEVAQDVTVDSKTHITHITTVPSGFADASIIAQEGHDLKAGTNTWKKGDVIVDGPYTVTIPEGKTGKFGILTMLLSQSGSRLHLQGNADAYCRYLLGYVNVNQSGSITFSEAPKLIQDDHEVFSRNDHGYGQLHNLGHQDTMIKNTYQVLTELNRRTAELEMTNHKFLTADETVEMTQFGDIRIVANFGRTPYQYEEGTVLPQYGFLVEAPDFAAYYALSYKGTEYENGAMFTLTSMDGSKLSDAKTVKAYHGFGEGPVNWDGKTYEVEGEATLTRSQDPTPPEPTDPPEPETTEPESTNPEATEPEGTEPEPTEPSEPETTEPESTNPGTTEPEGTEAEPTEPKPSAPSNGTPATGENGGILWIGLIAAASLCCTAVALVIKKRLAV